MASTGIPGGHAARHVAGWVPFLARLGYAAKGIVYVLVGFIAFRAAGAAGSPEGAQGALASLVDERGGRLLLVLVALGLACHVLWRLVQAVMDPEHSGHDAEHVALRAGRFLSAVIYASLAWTAWRLAKGAAAGGDDGQQLWIARLMDLPAGRWLVMAVGAGVIVFGLEQLVKAVRGDVTRRLARHDRLVRGVGRLGIAARGIVMLPIGWFIVQAGRHYDPQAAAGTEGALRMLERGGLLAFVGLGLLAYGAFQLVKAVYRRIQPPA